MERIELFCHSVFDKKIGLLRENEIIELMKESGVIGVTDYASILSWPSLLHEKRFSFPSGKMIVGCEMPVAFQNGVHSVYCLVKNEIGKRTLFQLISEVEKNNKQDNRLYIADNLLADSSNRDGLLIGGNEELLVAIADETDQETVERMASKYDFLVIDACDYNEDANVLLVEIGEKLNIPVVATGSPRFFTQEDQVAYDFLSRHRFGEMDICAHNRMYQTTEMLLEKLCYLTEEKAYEVVVTNSHLLADLCEEIVIVDGKRKYPYIENQDLKLQDLCFDVLNEKYGEGNIPDDVLERLEWELAAIRNTQMAFVFFQARELLDKMNLKPYEISTRGMWTSSYVAYLCGLSDINPIEFSLSPYFCFGIHGDKEIDMDLNFPADRQIEAHCLSANLDGVQASVAASVYGMYTELNIDRMLEKDEETYQIKHTEQEKELIYKKLKYVLCTLEIHPVGRILIPENLDITAYFPKVYVDADTPTTYFSYYSIDTMFYKLDLLGHDIPMLLNQMATTTGVCLADISLQDENVAGLFRPDADGHYGCEGIYEFHREVCMKILATAKPTTFLHLAKVLGMMHGTDIYSGNMENLLSNQVITMDEAIGTRDDIYSYLVEKGLEEISAYRIAECVRKGRIASGRMREAWDDMKKEMYEHGVEDWFITACEKIRYLFPKAHAISYAQMVWRLGYFKYYYPEVYHTVMDSYEEECRKKETRI